MDDLSNMDESHVVTFKESEAIEENQNNASCGDALTFHSIEHTMRTLMSEFRSETNKKYANF